MALSYDDVYLVPQRRIVNSRKDINVDVTIGRTSFKLPIIPANMRCSISREKAALLAQNNYFYIMHRFEGNDPKEQFANVVNFASVMNHQSLYTSISIGESSEWLSVFKRHLVIDCVTIDVAHGDSERMEQMIRTIRNVYSPYTTIIAGNVATPEAAHNLWEAGANYVKVGIGQGKACFLGETLVKTESGHKAIRDIVVGEKILSHDGTYNTVTAIHSRVVAEEMVEINGQTCTKDHLFYVVKREDEAFVNDSNLAYFAIWKKASELSDEFLIIKRHE